MSKNVKNVDNLSFLFAFRFALAETQSFHEESKRIILPSKIRCITKSSFASWFQERFPPIVLPFLSLSFSFFFFWYNDKQSRAHRWMRNQRPDVSAQDGCASCKVLLKKLLHLHSQGAPSLISDLLAGVTTCRSILRTAHFENRRRVRKQRKVRYLFPGARPTDVWFS